jgi:alpha-beta hydrolase superfamily lysophospholipase
MNSFIFYFHPEGVSLVDLLASRGIEVWTVDLRGQGATVAMSGRPPERYGLADLAGPDLQTAIRYVIDETRCDGAADIDVLGASLGASIVLSHLALHPGAPISRIVTLGGLVTWVDVPPMLKLLFCSPWLMGRIHFYGTRTMAGVALPLLGRYAPGLLSVYLHTSSTDIRQARTMVRTVDDPNPHINREIAEWIANRELWVDGVNVSRALHAMRNPILCVIALQDGIVPPRTSRALFNEIGSERKALLEVGSAETPIAHADLFLANGAQKRVFSKVADFLMEP